MAIKQTQFQSGAMAQIIQQYGMKVKLPRNRRLSFRWKSDSASDGNQHAACP